MLVLSRRPGESILIGEHVSVTVLAMEGNRIRLGISAPREVVVTRSEIYSDVQNQNAGLAPLMRADHCTLSDA